jgi:hypothetical protein
LVTILTHKSVMLLGEIIYYHIHTYNSKGDFRIGYDILSSVLDLNNL